MRSTLEQLKDRVFGALKEIKEAIALEELENQILGRKNGELTNVLKGLRDLGDAERKAIGQFANEVKETIDAAFQQKRTEFKEQVWQTLGATEQIDITQPALPRQNVGHYHPNTTVQRDLEDFFTSMGFLVADGPELESEYYNFTAVNVPADHPARDMQDTFYIKDHSAWVMRTHTSSVQVRGMQKYGAPLRMIVPGKCFRNEATDVRHEHTFYQLEGLVVDKDITFSHLKGVLEATVHHLYGKETAVRLRPKFYPFVEPGVNLEVTCFLCQGKGCRVCKASGWLEIGGAGMVHPSVLAAGNLDAHAYQGFAFGFGLTRLVMLKYGIEDIRLLENGSLRFLEQF